ncbi:hypothetical protein JCM8097_006463 [Rhodosporidiobolus ruineniae]
MADASDAPAPAPTQPATDEAKGVALPVQHPVPAGAAASDPDEGEEKEDSASPTAATSAAATSTAAATTTRAVSSTAAQDTPIKAADPAPTKSSSSPTTTTRPSAAASTTSASPADTPSASSSPSVKTVVAPVALPTFLLTSPAPTASAVSTLSSDGTATASPETFSEALAEVISSQGFVTTIRRGASPMSVPSGSHTSDALHPSQSLSEATQRANSTGLFTGISLAALVAILLLLVAAPKIKECIVGDGKRGKGADDDDSIWGPEVSTITLPRRSRPDDDDAYSWSSGSDEKGEKAFSSSSVTMVEHPSRAHLPLKGNVAGIGRRNTLKSIVDVPAGLPPPQAEFVVFPRTPTIIYSPPPPEPEPPMSFEPPRRILTPQSFPSTPTSQSFPPTPSRTPHPLLAGHYPPSTPPLSGLYSHGEWQRILHSPPILSPPPSTVGSSVSSPSRQQPRRPRRSPSPQESQQLEDLADDVDADDDASIYSRPSMMHPPPGLTPPHQRPPLPLLPMRLDGLAAMAARSGTMDSFPATPSTECAEESVVGTGWRRGSTLCRTCRESLTSKAEREMKPEESKSTTEQVTDKAKEAYESIASAVQPEGQKSTTQKAGDTLSGSGSGGGTGSGTGSGGDESLLQKTKDAVGLGGEGSGQTTSSTGTV